MVIHSEKRSCLMVSSKPSFRSSFTIYSTSSRFVSVGYKLNIFPFEFVTILRQSLPCSLWPEAWAVIPKEEKKFVPYQPC